MKEAAKKTVSHYRFVACRSLSLAVCTSRFTYTLRMLAVNFLAQLYHAHIGRESLTRLAVKYVQTHVRYTVVVALIFCSLFSFCFYFLFIYFLYSLFSQR